MLAEIERALSQMLGFQINGFYSASRVQLDKGRTGRFRERVKEKERGGLVTAGGPGDSGIRSLSSRCDAESARYKTEARWAVQAYLKSIFLAGKKEENKAQHMHCISAFGEILR